LPSKAGGSTPPNESSLSFQVSELFKVSLQVKMEPGRESELKQEFDTGSRKFLPPKQADIEKEEVVYS